MMIQFFNDRFQNSIILFYMILQFCLNFQKILSTRRLYDTLCIVFFIFINELNKILKIIMTLLTNYYFETII